MNEQYDFRKTEAKWAKKWVDEKIFVPDLGKAEDPYYALFMFPYPSAEGLHIGNFYAFTCVDVMAKYKKLQGKDVFEPVGFDAFGIHSENYALKIGETPRNMLDRTMVNFRKQLSSAGLGCDWTREADTTTPEYYKWTQWIFTKLLEKGLAVQKEAFLNWCPSCKTVLADEQIEGGECERCGTTPEKKKMRQWFFKITDYAQRLLDGLDDMDWSDITKAAQRNWIGRSEGAEIEFPVILKPEAEESKGESGDGSIRPPRRTQDDTKIKVFTTRPDTIFGVTFMVLAPEHELVARITTPKQKEAVEKYVKEAGAKNDLERMEAKEKTGVFTGAYAINPVSGEEIPIWVADYVLGGVGTGAIMAVPAHDERDWEFAKKYELLIRTVVVKDIDYYKSYLMGAEGISNEDLEILGVKVVEETESGSRKLKIPAEKLEDYILLVREKITPGFWNEVVGESIIFIFKDKNGKCRDNIVLCPDNEGEIDKLAAEFNGEEKTGGSGVWAWLARGADKFYEDLLIHSEEGINVYFDNVCHGLPTREAKKKMIVYLEEMGAGKGVVNYRIRDWCISRQRYWGPPVPVIYCDNCGVVPVPEKDLPVVLPELEEGWEPAGDGRGPLAKIDSFMKTICPKCGEPAEREADVMDNFLDSAWYFFRYVDSQNSEQIFDTEIAKKWLPTDIYVGGNEHAVLHLMYTRFITMGLHDLGLIDFDNPFRRFRANGMILKDGKKMSKSKGNVINPEEYGEKVGYDALKTYLVFLGPLSEDRSFTDSGVQGCRRWVEKIAKLEKRVKIPDQVEDDKVDSPTLLRKLHQTIKAVSSDFEDQKYNTAVAKLMELTNMMMSEDGFSKETWEKFLSICAPFAPAICEELWEKIGYKESIFVGKNWPEWDEELTKEDEIELVVQINGKLRERIKVGADISEDEAKEKALSSENVQKFMEGKDPRKVIYVPGKLVNIVI